VKLQHCDLNSLWRILSIINYSHKVITFFSFFKIILLKINKIYMYDTLKKSIDQLKNFYDL